MPDKRYKAPNGKIVTEKELSEKYGDRLNSVLSEYNFTEINELVYKAPNGKLATESELREHYGDKFESVIKDNNFEINYTPKKKEESVSASPSPSTSQDEELASGPASGSSDGQRPKKGYEPASYVDTTRIISSQPISTTQGRQKEVPSWEGVSLPTESSIGSVSKEDAETVKDMLAVDPIPPIESSPVTQDLLADASENVQNAYNDIRNSSLTPDEQKKVINAFMDEEEKHAAYQDAAFEKQNRILNKHNLSKKERKELQKLLAIDQEQLELNQRIAQRDIERIEKSISRKADVIDSINEKLEKFERKETLTEEERNEANQLLSRRNTLVGALSEEFDTFDERLNDFNNNIANLGTVEQEIATAKRNYGFWTNAGARVGLGFRDLGAGIVSTWVDARRKNKNLAVESMRKNLSRLLQNDFDASGVISDKTIEFARDKYGLSDSFFMGMNAENFNDILSNYVAVRESENNQEYLDFVERSQNVDAYIREHIRPNIEVDKIKSLGDALTFTVDGLTENTATLMTLSNGLGGELLFLGSHAANLVGEFEVDRKYGLNDYTDNQIRWASAGMSLSETAFHKYIGIGRQMKLFKRTMKSAGSQELKRSVAPTVREVLMDAGKGAGEMGKSVGMGIAEGFSIALTHNTIRAAILDEENVDFAEGMLDQAGGYISLNSVITSSRLIGGRALRMFSDRTRRRKVSENTRKIIDLEQELKEGDFSPEISRAIEFEIQELHKDNAENIKQVVDGFDGLSVEGQRRALDISSQVRSLEIALDQLPKDADSRTKELLNNRLHELEIEREQMLNQSKETMDKYEALSPEERQKYEDLAAKKMRESAERKGIKNYTFNEFQIRQAALGLFASGITVETTESTERTETVEGSETVETSTETTESDLNTDETIDSTVEYYDRTKNRFSGFESREETIDRLNRNLEGLEGQDRIDEANRIADIHAESYKEFLTIEGEEFTEADIQEYRDGVVEDLVGRTEAKSETEVKTEPAPEPTQSQVESETESETETDRDLEDVIGVSPDEVTDFDNVLVEEQKKLSELESKHGANHQLVKEQRAVVDALEKNAPITVEFKDGKTKVKGRGSDNPRTRRNAIVSEIENGLFDGAPETDLEGVPPERGSEFIADYSKNPYEVADALHFEKNQRQDDRINQAGTIEDAIAHHVRGGVTPKSYIDHTGLKGRDRASGLTQSYLKKDGSGLDMIAMEAEYDVYGDYDATNPRITTDMVVEFMEKYPNINDFYSHQNKSNVEINLEIKFEELTGLHPNKANIDIVRNRGKSTLKPSETTKTPSKTEVDLPRSESSTDAEFEKWYEYNGGEALGDKESVRQEWDEMNQSERDNYLPFHKSKNFKSIPKKAFDKLIDRLTKAFPKMKGKLVSDGKAMRERLNELREKGYDIVIDEKIHGFLDPENGKIYMDDALMNANTPIHEFGHLWTGVLEAQFPMAHKKLLDAVKRDKKAMDTVRNDPAYKHLKTDDQIADEALARYIGDKGEQKFLQEEGLTDRERTIRQRIFDEIQRIWEGIKKHFDKANKDIRKWTNEQWDNATMSDLTEAITGELLGGKDIEKKGVESKIREQQKELGVSFHLLDKSDFNADGTVKQSVLEAIAKEEAAIVSRAKADGTYMKAPNGKKSNLNEKQWVQVRTQRFKDWFGDWEIEADLLHLFQNNKFDYEKLKNVARRIQAERARVNGETEAVSREGNGASSRNDEASLIAEAKRRAERQTKISYEARTWAEHKENVRGQEQALEEYAKREGIWFDDYSVFEYEYGEYDQGIESDVWYDKDSDTHLIKTFGYDFARQVDPFTAIKNRIELHNKLSPFTAYEIIGFTKDQNGNFRFVLKQPFIEGEEVSSADLISFMKEQFDAVPVNKDATEFKSDLYTFKDLHAGNVIKVGNDIHIIDPQISKNEIESESNVSKVTDSNGEPMVVSHSTDKTFNEFINTQENDSGWLGEGFYFFGDRSLDGQYGSNVIEAFVNVKEPYYISEEEYNTLADKDDAEYSKDFTEDKISEGYDAVFYNGNLNQEWNIFHPNQIKSATDNVGTFSNETGDIRFQKESSKDLSKTEKTRAEKFLDLLDSWESEIDKFGRETLGINIPAVVAKGMIRMMRIAVKGGMNITQAFNAGMDYIRETDWYKKLSETDKAKVDAKTFRTVITNAVRQAIDSENKLNKIREKLDELKKEHKGKEKGLEKEQKSRIKKENEKRIRQEVVDDLVQFLSKNKIEGRITAAEVNRLIRYASRIATDSNAQKAFDRFLDMFSKTEIKAARRVNSRNTEEVQRIDVTSRVDQMLNTGMSESDIINSFETKWQRDVAFDHIERQRDITDEEASKEWDRISEDYDNKFRDKKPLKKRAKKWVNAVRKALFSSQIHAEDLTTESGLRRTRNLLRNFHGAKGLAKTVFDDAYTKIWGVKVGKDGHWALKKKLRHALDDMIFHRRVIELEDDYIAKGKEPVMHTGGWNKKKAEAKLREMKKELGEKTFNDLMKRSDIYFDTFKRLLKDKYDAGLISKESYESMKDLNYSPRMLASILLDFDGDLTERGKNNRSNRNGKTDAEIRSMGEGSLEHFFKESEWLLATALNSGYRNIAQNRLNNMLFREMEVQKERFEKIDAKVKAGEKLRRSETEFYDAYKELSEKIIENPIIGFTKDGNPKYKYNKPPSHNFVESYRWVDGVRHSFFVESKLAEEWFANREGFLHPKAKWWISTLSGSALVKYFATGNNPAFFISNTPRDMLYNYTFSDEFSPISIVGGAQMLTESIQASIDIIEYDFNLGDNLLEILYDYGLSMEFLSTQGRIESNKVLDLFPKRQKDNFQFIWRNMTFQQMQTANELMFRVGLAQRTIVNFLKQHGLKDVNHITEDLAKEKGYEGEQDMIDDMYETAVSQARGILDFSRGGWLSKDLEAFIPYTNVALQSTGKLLEKLHRNPKETTVKLAQVMGIMSTLPIMASIMYIALRYNPDDDDEEQDGKWKSAFKVYFETMDGLSKYERTNYAHIPLGIKDENGNWMAIRIAKEHALTAPLAVSDYYTQNFVRKLAGVKEESSAGLQGRLGFALRKNYAASITPQDFITDIPIARTLEVQRTGYDSFRDQFLPGTKGSVKYGIHSLQGEGLTNPNVEEFWKAMGEQFYLSPIRTKYAVESIITSPSTNPMVGLIYGGADVVWSQDKTMREIRDGLVDNISKSPFKRVIISANDYNRGYADREAREKEDDKFRFKLQKRNAKENELIKKVMEKEIDMKEFTEEAMKLRPEDPKKVIDKLKSRMKSKDISWELINLRGYTLEERARAIWQDYGDILDPSNREVLIEMKKAGGILSQNFWRYYEKEKERRKGK